MLELDDTFETLVKANSVAEGAAGPGRFAILADGAEARGDMFSALNHRARVRDETRHIIFARAREGADRGRPGRARSTEAPGPAPPAPAAIG